VAELLRKLELWGSRPNDYKPNVIAEACESLLDRHVGVVAELLRRDGHKGVPEVGALRAADSRGADQVFHHRIGASRRCCRVFAGPQKHVTEARGAGLCRARLSSATISRKSHRPPPHPQFLRRRVSRSARLDALLIQLLPALNEPDGCYTRIKTFQAAFSARGMSG